MSYEGIHWGYRTGSVKPVNCISYLQILQSLQLSHMLFAEACRKEVKYKNNYAETWKQAKYDGHGN